MTTTAQTTTSTLRAEGFSCPSCVAKIERQVGRRAGVESVKVHFATAKIVVVHDPAVVGVDELIAEVAKAGYVSAPSPF